MDELKEELLYWLALTDCEDIGQVRFQKLLQHFGSTKNAWEALFVE